MQWNFRNEIFLESAPAWKVYEKISLDFNELSGRFAEYFEFSAVLAP